MLAYSSAAEVRFSYLFVSSAREGIPRTSIRGQKWFRHVTVWSAH